MQKRFLEVMKRDCVACGECVLNCPKNAITIIQGVYAKIDKSLCVACRRCEKACPASAIVFHDIERVARPQVAKVAVSEV